MNGRIYDSQLGRMLQADPFIQFPTNTQSYNRYSYVLNNPLAYTDPSGYFLKKLFKSDVFRIAVAVVAAYYGYVGVWDSATAVGGWATSTGTLAGQTVSYVSTGRAIAAGTAAGATAGFAAGTSIAAFSGASLGDVLKAGGRGALGGISGGSGALGSSFGAFGRIASAAAGGCGAGAVSGGSCKTGATYAGMAAALTVSLESWSGYRVTARTAKSGAVVKEVGTVAAPADASRMGIAITAPTDPL